jgi:hypothetical protein
VVNEPVERHRHHDHRKETTVTKEADNYFIDRDQLKRLNDINKAMFGDGSNLTPDRRRDLANSMWLLLREVGDQPLDAANEKATA